MRPTDPDVRQPSAPHVGCGCSHGSAPGGERGAFRARLPAGHVLATLMDEHANMLGLLDQLAGLAAKLPAEGSMVFARIESLGRQLLSAEPHHQREERVLFPALRERGITGPPDAMTNEHVGLRALKHEVVDLAAKATMGERVDDSLRQAVGELVDMLRNHIAKEDGILYPMALETIPEPEWTGLKQQCDAVGYCCGHH